METKNKARNVMYMVLMIIFISGVNAQTIDLNEPVEENKFSPLVDKINEYDIVNSIARHYNLISVEIENYTVVLEFEGNKLKEIRESQDEVVDLELHFSRDDVEYLFNNWESMSTFERIKFFLRSEMSIKDIINFSAIAMSVR